MRKVLITGSAGFLGSHLVDHLLAREIEVVAYDNLFRGKLGNLANAATNPRFSFVKGDILNLRALESASEDCDTIFHLAAINGTKFFYEIRVFILKVNIQGTENVLRVAEKKKIPRVVFTSSSEVYGNTNIIPTPEESGSMFVPSTSIRWSYAVSKLVDEHICLAAARAKQLKTVILRVFNAYGPRQVSSEYGQVVGMFATRILEGKQPIIYGSGGQTRAFTYVSDIVEGITKAAEAEGITDEVFNLGSQEEITINELAETMIRLCNMEHKLNPTYAEGIPDEPQRRCPLIERAKKAFGYQPKIDLISGLEKTLDWFREQMASSSGRGSNALLT